MESLIFMIKVCSGKKISEDFPSAVSHFHSNEAEKNQPIKKANSGLKFQR